MQTIIVSRGSIEQRIDKIKELLSKKINSPYPPLEFLLIENEPGKRSISIDKVRELINWINIKPRLAKNKVALIGNAQLLGTEAQNALLKILEEPPEYSQIFLSVKHEDDLLKTIISRCIVVPIRSENINNNLSEEDINDFFSVYKLSESEKIDWVTNNKEALKNRDDVIRRLDEWEIVLRGILLFLLGPVSNDSITKDFQSIIRNKKESPETIKEKILFLQKVKNGIEKHNANAPLSVEALLLNL